MVSRGSNSPRDACGGIASSSYMEAASPVLVAMGTYADIHSLGTLLLWGNTVSDTEVLAYLVLAAISQYRYLKLRLTYSQTVFFFCDGRQIDRRIDISPRRKTENIRKCK